MPEDDRTYIVQNPNYSGEQFEDAYRMHPVGAEHGVAAKWSQLTKSGQWKVREFHFDTGHWSDRDRCEQWVRDNRDAYASFGGPVMQFECLEALPAGERTSSVPTESEYELIRRFALEDLPREQYYVRPMRLTNDQWSRTNYIRLSRGFQRSLIDQATGKALLIGHPENTLMPAEPVGLFFDAYEDRDEVSGKTWGVYKFFLPRTSQNEHARAMMDSGAWRHVSVGFAHDIMECSICGNNLLDGDKCKHVPLQRYPISEIAAGRTDYVLDQDDPSKVICGIVCRGRGTLLEGSIVYLPELVDTRIGLQAHQELRRGDIGAAKRSLLSGKSHAPRNEAQAAQVAGHASGDGTSGGATSKTTDEGRNPLVDEKLKDLEAKLEAKETAIAELQAKHDDAAEKLADATKQLEAVKPQEASLRAAIVADVTRLAGLTKREPELEAFKAAFGEDMASMPADKLIGLQSQWLKIVDETMPGGMRQSTPSQTDAQGNEPAAPAEPEKLPMPVRPAI